MSDNFDLVPVHLAVQAMRDNGYRNTAYAVAELIDNGVQAGASTVELLCREEEELVQQRTRRRIRKVAVLDNGSGMTAATLRIALQFGNGSHLNDRDGIGRFGMGLPSASISQAQRVEVWSWRDGPQSALYSYVDLRDVASGSMRAVPEPRADTVPVEWSSIASLGRSGTLVVWSDLDRCMWRTGRSIIKNSEFLIARMYRKFLHSGALTIRMASFTTGRDKPTIDEYATANDPGYLLVPSSTPAPFDETAMFQPDGDRYEVEHVIGYAGVEHKVRLRFSLAAEHARNRANAGAMDYGKHAARNVGISLVRADRELDMDQALVNGYDPRERWWGVEIDFPPSLDELFGVTNNKQSARNFSEVAERLKSLKAASVDWHGYKQDLEDDEDPTGPLVEILDAIDKRLTTLRELIRVQKKGTRSAKRRHDPNSAEAIATEATAERKDRGHRGASDEDEGLPPEDRKEALTRDLIEAGIAREQASEMAATTITNGVKFTWAEADLEGMAFFTVRAVAGEIVIKLNVKHPAYTNLMEILEEDEDPGVAPEQLRQRLNQAGRGLRLLLMAWARLEDEQPTTQRRMEIQQLRNDWGSVAYRFLQDD